MLAVMGRPSLRGVFLVVVVAMVGFHLVSVTAAALPPNRYSEAVEPVNGYLRPYFTQNWRLFAPNPIDSDRELRFQAAYRDENGDIQITDWVDWTDVELDLVHHKIVGRRGGYITNKLVSSLSASRARLTTDQRTALKEAGTQDAPLSWTELTQELDRHGQLPDRVRSYVRYELATARLATDVLLSRYPDDDIVAVRYSLYRNPVLRYDDRHADAEEELLLRRPNEDVSGWRRPVRGTDAERDVIAEFDRRHR